MNHGLNKKQKRTFERLQAVGFKPEIIFGWEVNHVIVPEVSES